MRIWKILNENEEMLEQLTGKEMTKLTLDVILNNLYISFLTLYYKFNLIKSDPNDNKFLNYAVIANAKFIMTEDRHFVADTVWKNKQSQLKAINTILRYRMTMYHVFAIAE